MSDAVLPFPVLLTTIVAVCCFFHAHSEESEHRTKTQTGETICGDDGSNYSWYEMKPQRSR